MQDLTPRKVQNKLCYFSLTELILSRLQASSLQEAEDTEEACPSAPLLLPFTYPLPEMRDLTVKILNLQLIIWTLQCCIKFGEKLRKRL